MSKINVCKICVNKDICIVREDCIYWQTINQQSQLSDNVEEKFIIDYLTRKYPNKTFNELLDSSHDLTVNYERYIKSNKS